MGRLLADKKVYTFDQAKQMLAMAYQTDSGLFDHVAHQRDYDKLSVENRRPLAAQEVHPGEDVVGTSAVVTSLTEFANLRIHERYGYSLSQFWELPKWICDEIVHESRQFEERVLRKLNDK